MQRNTRNDIFTRHPDPDSYFLYQLSDKDLYNACRVDTYSLHLCQKDKILKSRIKSYMDSVENKISHILYSFKTVLPFNNACVRDFYTLAETIGMRVEPHWLQLYNINDYETCYYRSGSITISSVTYLPTYLAISNDRTYLIQLKENKRIGASERLVAPLIATTQQLYEFLSYILLNNMI